MHCTHTEHTHAWPPPRAHPVDILLCLHVALLQNGADPNIRNNDGKTAVDLADPLAKQVLTGRHWLLCVNDFVNATCIVYRRISTGWALGGGHTSRYVLFFCMCVCVCVLVHLCLACGSSLHVQCVCVLIPRNFSFVSSSYYLCVWCWCGNWNPWIELIMWEGLSTLFTVT